MPPPSPQLWKFSSVLKSPPSDFFSLGNFSRKLDGKKPSYCEKERKGLISLLGCLSFFEVRTKEVSGRELKNQVNHSV